MSIFTIGNHVWGNQIPPTKAELRMKSKQVSKDVKAFFKQLDAFEKESRKANLIVK